jgi:hypothetical protein
MPKSDYLPEIRSLTEINTISCAHSSEWRFSSETNLNQAQKSFPRLCSNCGSFICKGGQIVADTLAKPVETVPSTAAVGDGPAQQTPRLVQRRVVRPLSSRPTTRIHTAKAFLHERPGIETELAEVRKAWRVYRGTNSRDAVYIYLSKVFQVVSRWQRLACVVKNARAVLRLQANAPQMKAEPFAIVIFCTADPEIVDAKTRSKWSRVLRYAVWAKPPGQRLIDFIKAKGGINECLACR